MIDKILQEHPKLNPIKLIWAYVKNWVAQRNVTFLHEDVELCKPKFSSIGPQQWIPKIKHCIKIENVYRDLLGVLENAIEPFIISLNQNRETADVREKMEEMSYSD